MDDLPRFAVTVVLACGCTFDVHLHESASGPRLGDFYACSTHSPVVGYDPDFGDPIHDRDQRVIELSRAA